MLSGKRVLGPAREIREVENAFAAYEAMPSWNPSCSKDLLAAHRLMLAALVPDPGKFRTRSVGIAQGRQIVHLAPPTARIPGLMKNLPGWLLGFFRRKYAEFYAELMDPSLTAPEIDDFTSKEYLKLLQAIINSKHK